MVGSARQRVSKVSCSGVGQSEVWTVGVQGECLNGDEIQRASRCLRKQPERAQGPASSGYSGRWAEHNSMEGHSS